MRIILIIFCLILFVGCADDMSDVLPTEREDVEEVSSGTDYEDDLEGREGGHPDNDFTGPPPPPGPPKP